jgi:hypothetical protein
MRRVLAHARKGIAFQRELVRALAAAGVPLLAGTDPRSAGGRNASTKGSPMVAAD